MPLYNLIEYSIIEKHQSLFQYYRDEQALTGRGAPDNFPGNSTCFKFKQKK